MGFCVYVFTPDAEAVDAGPPPPAPAGALTPAGGPSAPPLTSSRAQHDAQSAKPVVASDAEMGEKELCDLVFSLDSFEAGMAFNVSPGSSSSFSAALFDPL